MFSQFSFLEIVFVLVILLVIFGPKRLPSLGRNLGHGMREFKDSLTGDRKGDAADGEDERPAITRAHAQETPEAPVAQAPSESVSERRG